MSTTQAVPSPSYRDFGSIAQRQRQRNLGANLRRGLPSILVTGTPWQRSGLVLLQASGLTGFARPNGTLRVAYIKPAVKGGYTEEWRDLVTSAQLTQHLGDNHGT